MERDEETQTMAIRRILVPLSGRYDAEDPENLDRPALQSALVVARAFDAHVDVLCVIGEPSKPDERWSEWMPGYGVHQVIDWVKTEGKSRSRRARLAFDEVFSGCEPPQTAEGTVGTGFSATFVERVGELRQTVGEHGRVSDLIITASSRARWETPFRPILEACLRRTARPILVSPASGMSTVGEHVALAWNDSIESARAVAASLAFLRRAKSVHVISCRERSTDGHRLDAVTEYLAWHGVNAESMQIEAPPKRSASAIVDAAKSSGCDLVAMGAYIHTRTHALLFGSLTEHVLSGPGLPTLIVP